MLKIQRGLMAVVAGAGLFVAALPAQAQTATVVSGNSIVGGAVCVGFDCPPASAPPSPLANGEMVLQENNLRIRLWDLSLPTGLGQIWNLEANDTANGGAPYFGFQLKNEPYTGVVRAEDAGFVPEYSCPAGTMLPTSSNFASLLTGQKIAVGQPIIQPQFEAPCATDPVTGEISCTVVCGPGSFTSIRSLLTAGHHAQASDNPGTNLGIADGVAIGFESARERDVVSIGRADMTRQLVRVGAALASTDVLTVAGLNSLAPQITAANAALDLIERRIRALELFRGSARPYDLSGDGCQDGRDLVAMGRVILGGTNNPRYDLNFDGVVNVADLLVLQRFVSNFLRFGAACR